MKKITLFIEIVLFISIILFGIICTRTEVIKPLRVVTDINIGESQEVKLSNGEVANLKLLDVEIIRDEVYSVIRAVNVKVVVNGEEATLSSGNYNLPVRCGGVQIDCPVVKDYYANSRHDAWGLDKDARIRLWPENASLITPGTFVYPVKQRWSANDTQMANEACYVGWGEDPTRKKVYYHNGLDFGGAEGLTEIVSATDGLVVSAGGDSLTGYENTPVRHRYDQVYILDNRGWYYRYTHLSSIDPAIRPGMKVKTGQKIGAIGKEGDSGGWVHLHFDIQSMQPSGKWGTEEGYAYIWESYVNQYNPSVIAVARPHHIVWKNQEVILNGRKSKSINGEIKTFEWIFSDGSKAKGPVQKKSYKIPGTYSEVLKVADPDGNIDYDYSVVYVIDRMNLDKLPPGIHAAYYPTIGIKPGEPVTLLVSTFRTEYGNEVWDFGDGSSKVEVKSIMKPSEGERFAYMGYDIVGGKYADLFGKHFI